MKTRLITTLFLLMLLPFTIVKAQFTNFTAGNSTLPSDFVCGGVAVDNSNNIWVGTDAGVAKYNGTSWTVYTTADGLPVDIISCIAVDNSNNIWIGTDGDGVAKFNGSTWTKYSFTDGLCDNGIHAIACDSDGSVWFGSWGGGVSKLNGSIWTTYNTGNGWPDDAGTMASVYYISVDASNNKWFGTDMGLVKYDNTNFTAFNQTTTPDLKSNYITAVSVDANNNKWLGVLAKGIAKLNSSNTWVANYDTTNGIYNNGITDIQIDSEGNIWLGEYTIYGSLIVGGITKFNSSTGTGVSYSATDGLTNEQVFRIAIDNNDDIWIATSGGVFKYTQPSGLSENNCNNILNIYPNPAHSNLIVNGDFNTGKIEITDITGRMLIEQTANDYNNINVQKFNNGVYLVKIIKNETIYNAKFIKE